MLITDVASKRRALGIEEAKTVVSYLRMLSDHQKSQRRPGSKEDDGETDEELLERAMKFPRLAEMFGRVKAKNTMFQTEGETDAE